MASLVSNHRLAAPLGNREFRILWLGQGISAMGDPLQAVAIAWLVLDRTGSPGALATALLALTVPRALIALAGGIATDRFSPRTVMMWCDIARAVAIGLLATLAHADRLDEWVLLGLLAVSGLAGGIFTPAATSITPLLVTPAQRQSANALMQMTPQLAMTLGAPVAGALVTTIGPTCALGLNALSFAVAALSAWLLRDVSPASQSAVQPSLWRAVTAGLIAVWRLPWLRALLGVDALLTLAVSGPLSVGLPVLVRTTYAAGPETYSVLLAAFGAGSILGMGLIGARTPVQRRGVFFCLMQLAQAPLIAALVWDVPLLAAGALGGVGVLHGLSGVVYLTLIQDGVSPALRGRVMSVVALVAFAMVPLSQILTGVLSGLLGPAPVFVLAAASMGVGAGAGLLAPALRQIGDR